MSIGKHSWPLFWSSWHSGLLPSTYSNHEYMELCVKSAVEEAEYGLPFLRRKAMELDPEINHDSEWATAYSIAIDR